MGSPLARLHGCHSPLGVWINARATMPDLFSAYALKRDVSDNTLIRAANQLRETSAYPFAITGFARHFFRFFRDAEELINVEARFGRLGFSTETVWGADTNAERAHLCRFVESDIWRLNRDETLPAGQQTALLERILEWIEDEAKVELPLENSLPANYQKTAGRWQALAKLLFALPQNVYDQLLPIIYGSGMAHMLPLPQELKDVLNGIPGAIAKGPTTETALFVFNDPVRALYTIAQGIDGVEDPAKFVEVYLPTYAHALADPRFLIAIFQALGTQDKPVAPPFPRDGNWDALPAFMEKFGFDRVHVARWCWVMQALEPQVTQHLIIAFASRLRPFYEKAARESSKAEHFEDVMGRVSRLTGVSAEDAAAWLKWKHTLPLTVEERVTSVHYRYHAFAGGRGAWGKMLRANTMVLDYIFDGMRRRKNRPIKSTTPWGQALQVIVETQNGFFARGLTPAEQKKRILAALKELGYPNVAALQAQFPSWQTDADGARKVQVIRVHLERLKLIKEEEETS